MVVHCSDPAQAASWLAAAVSGGLTSDSRAVHPGDGFVAWPGRGSDGRRHVPEAFSAGAAACLVEADGAQAFAFGGGPVAALPGLKAAAGHVADTFFGRPSLQLDVLAVTGTNGKTTTAWWLAQALTHLGRRCGVLGTLGIGEPPCVATGGAGSVEPSGLTTPDALTLHAAFRRFVDQGLQACALEASSIGLAEQRLTAARIDVALFTNFTRDHLDHHGDMATYWAAKRSLFDWPGLRAAVVNVDDARGVLLNAELAGGTLDVWTVSSRGPARLQAHGLEFEHAGMAFELVEGALRVPVLTPVVGDFNVSNLLGVVAGLRALGVPLPDAAAALTVLSPVPGRLQRVQRVRHAQRESSGSRSGAAADGDAQDPLVIVDYAHTPDALDKILQALRPLASARGGQLVCLFGCGGNRDSSKRPLMGAIAERLADRVVLTSDNPRHEAPGMILAQIVAGLARPAAAEVIEDRRVAIVHAVHSARRADVVLLAGKGHEPYQEVAGIKHPFSDEAEAGSALLQRLEAWA